MLLGFVLLVGKQELKFGAIPNNGIVLLPLERVT
jgi:hypothetical protein